MKKGILERLKDGVVLGAEGYLFELERRGYLKAGPFVPEAVLDFPEAVKELHREFLGTYRRWLRFGNCGTSRRWPRRIISAMRRRRAPSASPRSACRSRSSRMSCK